MRPGGPVALIPDLESDQFLLVTTSLARLHGAKPTTFSLETFISVAPDVGFVSSTVGLIAFPLSNLAPVDLVAVRNHLNSPLTAMGTAADFLGRKACPHQL